MPHFIATNKAPPPISHGHSDQQGANKAETNEKASDRKGTMVSSPTQPWKFELDFL